MWPVSHFLYLYLVGTKSLSPHYSWNCFRVMKIRSKCKFFPECWFQKGEKGSNFVFTDVGFGIKAEFKISPQFQLLNVEYAKFQAEN